MLEIGLAWPGRVCDRLKDSLDHYLDDVDVMDFRKCHLRYQIVGVVHPVVVVPLWYSQYNACDHEPLNLSKSQDFLFEKRKGSRLLKFE